MVSNKAEDGAGGVDELFESLGIDEVRTWRGREVEGSHSVPGPRPAADHDHDERPKASVPLLAVLGLAAVVIIGGAIWLASRSSGETTATAESEATEITATGAADVDVMAEELRATMASLGFDEVEVDANAGMVYVAGTVSTDQDLSILRSTALAMADPGMIDISGVQVSPPVPNVGAAPGAPAPGAPPRGAGPPRGGPPPGAPPPGFVQPTKEQLDALLRELDRVLTDTPMIYDPGSSTLNELQLEVLDTIVISLLESHPGVPIRLVGYTDGNGSDYANSLLSFDRANAARDYLIAKGVPEFIVRAEGRGERDASGEDDADRRIEIEVVDLSAP